VPTAITTALAQLDAERVGAADTTSAAAAGLPHVLFDVPAPDAPLQAEPRQWTRRFTKAVYNAAMVKIFDLVQFVVFWLLGKVFDYVLEG